MRYEKIKLFWNRNSNDIIAVPYNPESMDYYDFLSQYRNKGFNQIIITSEIMITIIKDACIEDKCFVNKIEFVEDDYELQKEINLLLENIKSNPIKIIHLIERVKFLSEKSSIDLKKVYLKGEYSIDGTSKDFFIQSNGIIGVNKESLAQVKERMVKLLKEHLVQ